MFPTYHNSDKEVKYVPATRPEVYEVVYPLEKDLQDKHVERKQVEHAQNGLYVCVYSGSSG